MTVRGIIISNKSSVKNISRPCIHRDSDPFFIPVHHNSQSLRWRKGTENPGWTSKSQAMTTKGEKQPHPGRQNIFSPDGETKAGFSPLKVFRVETFICLGNNGYIL